MPYADTRRDRADSWAEGPRPSRSGPVRGDLHLSRQTTLASELEPVRKTAQAVVLVVPDEAVTANSVERRLADVVVRGPYRACPVRAPRGRWPLPTCPTFDVSACWAASRDALEAGRRAGAGAVIGIATNGPASRLELLRGQPDRIIEPGEVAATDSFVYGSGRRHRERVLLNPGPT